MVAGAQILGHSTASAADECVLDPVLGKIICEASGGEPAPPPSEPPYDDPGRRYVYTATDPGIGDCYFWSDVPGGLDAWDPANDPAVIAITTSLPECPATLDVETRAWQIFRSWDLDAPLPDVTPSTGVTGSPSVVAVPEAPAIVYAELLPDGRTLQVRARTALLVVDWGDDTLTEHDPNLATSFPTGDVAHVYERKTCTAEYRNDHPSGGLCHPTLAAYPITVSFIWAGEYSVGAGWTPLGTLAVSASVSHDVDEARGLAAP